MTNVMYIYSGQPNENVKKWSYKLEIRRFSHLWPRLYMGGKSIKKKLHFDHGISIRWYCKTPCAQMYPPFWNPSMSAKLSENSYGWSNDR